MNDVMKKAALAYAKRYGWYVFPCKPKDKRPLIQAWQHQATIDPDKIEAWWNQWPDANIGIACGFSNILVVDLDTDKGGIDSWRSLGVDDSGALISLTGGGGQHLVFKASAEYDIHNSTSKLGEGIDVRGNGGYIIAPPSIHPNGREYAWEASAHPEDFPLANMPATLLSLLKTSDTYKLPDKMQIGIRDTELFKFGCAMRAKGCSEDEVFAALKTAYDARADKSPGMGDDYWRAKAKHICETYDAGETPEQVSQETRGKIYRFAELWAMPVDPLEDVVTGFVPGKSVTMFSGDGGLGKSYVLLEMAMCVSQGLDWLGMKTNKMPVLILDLENGLSRSKRRVKEIAKGWALAQGVDPDVSIIFEGDFGLANELEMKYVYQLIEEHGFGLIILDSLVDFVCGLDENSNSDMSLVCKNLRAISTKTGCSIVAIHHVPKGGSGTNLQSARGASALKDNVDCSIQVIRSNDTLTMRHDKARDWPEAAIKANLNWMPGSFNTSLLDVGVAQGTTSGNIHEQAILDSMTSSKWYKCSEVIRDAAKLANGSQPTYSRKMNDLIADGLVLDDRTNEYGSWGKSFGVKLA